MFLYRLEDFDVEFGLHTQLTTRRILKVSLAKWDREIISRMEPLRLRYSEFWLKKYWNSFWKLSSFIRKFYRRLLFKTERCLKLILREISERNEAVLLFIILQTKGLVFIPYSRSVQACIGIVFVVYYALYFPSKLQHKRVVGDPLEGIPFHEYPTQNSWDQKQQFGSVIIFITLTVPFIVNNEVLRAMK